MSEEDAGVASIAMNANDAGNYRHDFPERMGPFAKEAGREFPYLHDEDPGGREGLQGGVCRGQLDGPRPSTCGARWMMSWPAGGSRWSRSRARAATSSGSPARGPNTPVA